MTSQRLFDSVHMNPRWIITNQISLPADLVNLNNGQINYLSVVQFIFRVVISLQTVNTKFQK